MAKPSDAVVRLIGAFKLTKAALLLALGIAGLAQTPGELGRPAEMAIAWMGVFPGRQTLTRALHHLLTLNPSTERRLAALALAYALVFVVEGSGLLRRKKWAEWLTVVVTASFIPIEVYELVTKFGVGKVVALVLNVAIVIYLLWRRIEEHRGFESRIRHTLHLT